MLFSPLILRSILRMTKIFHIIHSFAPFKLLYPFRRQFWEKFDYNENGENVDNVKKFRFLAINFVKYLNDSKNDENFSRKSSDEWRLHPTPTIFNYFLTFERTHVNDFRAIQLNLVNWPLWLIPLKLGVMCF